MMLGEDRTVTASGEGDGGEAMGGLAGVWCATVAKLLTCLFYAQMLQLVKIRHTVRLRFVLI